MPRVQGLLLSARRPCVSTHAHGCKVHKFYVTAVDGPRRVGTYSARASMQKERSKWRVVTGEEEPEWSSKHYVGPSVTQHQEAELLRRNVKAAREKSTQLKAVDAITGLVNVALYHKSDLLGASAAAAELAKLLQLPCSRRKGIHIRQLHRISQHLKLPPSCSQQPHAAAIWQLCQQHLQLVQKHAGQTVLEADTVSQQWLWLLTGEVQTTAGQQHIGDALPGEVGSPSSSSSVNSEATSNSVSQSSAADCLSLLNPAACDGQLEPYTLTAASDVVQLAALDVSSYTAAVQAVHDMECQKLMLREVLLSSCSQRTEQQVKQLKALLHVHPMFQQLPEKVRELAAGVLEYISAPAGTVLYESGDIMESWYIALSGKLRIMQTHSSLADSEQQTCNLITAPSSTSSSIPMTDAQSILTGTAASGQSMGLGINGAQLADAAAASGSATISAVGPQLSLLQAATAAREQRPLTLADLTSSKDKYSDGRLVCMTHCELAVLGRSQLIPLVIQQQEAALADRVELLRGNAVFARRTMNIAQRAAESCVDVDAAPGALLLAHCVINTADTAVNSTSSSLPTDMVSPRASVTDSPRQEQHSRVSPLLSGSGYAFIAYGECRITCKVKMSRSKPDKQPGTTATAGSVMIPAQPVDALSQLGSFADRALSHRSRQTTMEATSQQISVIEAMPVLQLGPGDVVSTAALASCAASEVTVVAQTGMLIVWLPAAAAEQHLGSVGLAELSSAAADQAERLQQLLGDAVAARQAIWERNYCKPSAHVQHTPRQSNSQLLSSTNSKYTLCSTNDSLLNAPVCNISSLQSPRSTASCSAAPALAAHAKHCGAASSPHVSGTPRVQEGVYPSIQAEASSRSTRRCTGPHSNITKEVDALQAAVRSSSQEVKQTPPGQWSMPNSPGRGPGTPRHHTYAAAYVAQRLSAQSSGALTPAPALDPQMAIAACLELEQLLQETSSRQLQPLSGDFSPEISSRLDPYTACRAGSSPIHTVEQQLQGTQPCSSLPTRVQMSAAVKQQLLVADSDSMQLLPHTCSRESILLSGVSDPATGAISLDPPCSGIHAPAAGLAEYQWNAGSSFLTAQEQLMQHRSVPVSPRVVVIPSPPAAAVRHTTREPVSNSPRGIAAADRSPRVLQQERQRSPRLRAASSARCLSPTQQPGTQTPTDAAVTAASGQSSKTDTSCWAKDSRSSGKATPVSTLASNQASQQQQTQRNLIGSRSTICRASLMQPSSPVELAACTSQGTVGFRSMRAVPARRSTADMVRLTAAPDVPLDVDPAAPPLGGVKLSRPTQGDVEYVLGRWSHRWHSLAQTGHLQAAEVYHQLPRAEPAVVSHSVGDSSQDPSPAVIATLDCVANIQNLSLYGVSAVEEP